MDDVGKMLACCDTAPSRLVQEREGIGWASTLQFSTIIDGVSDCSRRIVVSCRHEVLLDIVILGLSKTEEEHSVY